MNLPVNWKILLIDDDEDIRDVMEIILKDAGYSVVCAPDGYTGLMLTTREEPQIVITDIKMPGLNGLEVLEKIKKLKPETEVIITTGFGDIEKAVKALQYDASDFISKPIDDDALHTALKRAMKRYVDKKQLSDYTTLLENENLKTSSELVKSVNFQSSLIENSMDGILGCNENDIIVTYNRSMEKLLGYPKALVLKKMKVMSFFKPHRFLKLKQDLSGSDFGGKNRLFVYETSMLSVEQKDIPVQVSGFILSQETVPNSMVLFISDLRDLRTLEQEVTDQAKLLHREKMVSLGRLASSMVHEINNPLSGILNYIRLMIRISKKYSDIGSERGLSMKSGLKSGMEPDLTQARLQDRLQERFNKFNSYLEIIEAETQRCSDLVSGLLKFSRKTKLEQTSIDVAELIQHSLLLCRHKLELSNIIIQEKYDTDVPHICGDFNQLEQCMINLIFNAIDAMANGGRLEIKTGFDSKENLVFIAIKDNGKGISKDDINFIFEPFFTTKNEGYGVGLGLSLTYGIIEKHKGTIVVESTLEKGSEFVIKLPPKQSGV
ncbi:hybrid sensor histidine kinase/response regulator [Desulfobacula phenolica]|uniref:histidine kinase n=1 Tax=Desulfobacula phenolica TaxID=90732 RepID=A0A1H2GGE8_9BACT|nr:response regulator [Desulfobacula phenolica]SDU18579.1 PAS domain S-box-containing protein [Desulfobacula phenolica]